MVLRMNNMDTRKARSTVRVVGRVVGLAREAMLFGKCCAVVTVDVKNAFNSANCGRIKESLAKINAPGYLANLIESSLVHDERRAQ